MTRKPWETGGSGRGSWWHRFKGLVIGHGMGWHRILAGPCRGARIWCRGSDLRTRLGRYEPEVSAAILALHTPGAGCLDVGCGYGYHLLLMAGLSEGVHGVDVDAERARLARKALERSGLYYATTGAYRLEELGGWASLVKMDVEGQEASILRRSVGVLEAGRPSLVIEVHGSGLLGECLSILQGAGYGAGALLWASAGGARGRGWLVAVGKGAPEGVREELRAAGFEGVV